MSQEESSFLSDPITAFQIRPILEQLYEDLNSYHETSISIDQFNSIELKLFPFYPNPPKVYDWTVPLALINIMKRIEPNWDLTMTKASDSSIGIGHQPTYVWVWWLRCVSILMVSIMSAGLRI